MTMRLPIPLMLLLALFVVNHSYAQKAKFKNKLTSVQKTQLPKFYTNPDARTYDVVVKGSYGSNVNAYDNRVYGWTLDEENPNLKGVVSIYGYSVSSPEKQIHDKSRQDKDGNVIERWKEFSYSATATGHGTLYIYGNERIKDKEAMKAEASMEKQKENEELAANPFLTTEDVAEAEESDIGEDEGIEDDVLTRLWTERMDKTKTITTKSFRSATAAFNAYTKRRAEFNTFRADFPTAVYKSAMSRVNYNYGYAPVKYKFYLKYMKNEDHPEYKMWNAACDATQTLFKSFKYNKPIDEKQAKFDPIITYFSDILNRISPNDKKQKKLLIAAYNNLSQIMLSLDRCDQLMRLSSRAKDSKYLLKSATRRMKEATEIKTALEQHRLATRHYINTTDDPDEDVSDEDIEEVEIEEDDPDAQGR